MFGKLIPLLLAGVLLTGCGTFAKEQPVQQTLTERQAAQRVDDYIHSAIGQLTPPPSLTAGLKSTLECDDPTDRGPLGRVNVEHRYTLPDLPRTANQTTFDTLASYWSGNGYRVLRDERGAHIPELAVESQDGFVIVITTNVLGELSIVGSSPCVWPQGSPTA